MSTRKEMIIVGTGASAQIAQSQFEQCGCTVVAFAADRKFCVQPEFCGRPLYALDDLPSTFSLQMPFYVAVGYNDMGMLRARLVGRMQELGFSPCSYISPTAHVSADAHIGEHCYVGDYVSIQPFACVQNNVVILSGSTIGHHARIEAHGYICQHVNINGYVRLGEYCFVGAGSTLLDGVSAGRNSFIGACARVHVSMPQDSYFNPQDAAVHPHGYQKFTAWFAKRQQFYAHHDH